MNFRHVAVLLLAMVGATESVAHANSITQDQARAALHKCLTFYRTQVGYEGAYLYRYAADLSAQEGEDIASRTSGWTEPPGTPSVGEGFLKAWQLTDDSACRDATIEAAAALVRSQLESGGWDSRFDLGPEGRKRYRYRIDGNESGRNSTTFDDNKSQSAMTFLMHVDEELNFKDSQIHEAVEYGLKRFLQAQYPNGAWPQQYVQPPDAAEFPVKPAAYPQAWSRKHVKSRYTSHYTLNDNNMAHIIDMLFEAQRIYDREDCYQAAIKTADFFLLAQMPEPQPGWAQQYNADMQPVWARKFEPPAVTGGESQSVMKKLIDVYRHTADPRFLKPLPSAIAYYRQSLLDDGKLARFYELQTNRPLYFTKDYELTYSDSDMPTHYAFKVSSGLSSIQRAWDKAVATQKENLVRVPPRVTPARLTKKIASRAADVMATMDSRGAWVEQGKMDHQVERLPVIETRTLIRNLETLARYVGATE